jgi:hypothetical protein
VEFQVLRVPVECRVLEELAVSLVSAAVLVVFQALAG